MSNYLKSHGTKTRVSKEDKKDIKGKTNWAALIAEEKKEGVRKQ
ncbi:hypothetical protein [Marinobacter sp. ANT_B65]|nr:hypothetical protein [Marinobacter sp. ANT_B65]